MSSWLKALLVCLVCIVLLCSAEDTPEKRPALLSRYGRAVLPRYGKRSAGSTFWEHREASDLLLCRDINGELLCTPYVPEE